MTTADDHIARLKAKVTGKPLPAATAESGQFVTNVLQQPPLPGLQSSAPVAWTDAPAGESAEALIREFQKADESRVPAYLQQTEALPKQEVVDLRTLPPEQQREKLEAIRQLQRQQTQTPQEVVIDIATISGEKETRPAPAGLSQDNAIPFGAPPSAAIQETPPAPEAPSEPIDSQTAATPVRCPHCAGYLREIPDEEPSEQDRRSFVQTILGLQCFSRGYDLLGGHLFVLFRSLTNAERDAIYAQVTADMESGRLKGHTQLDVIAAVQRYRLALQVQQIRMPKKEYPFCEGLSPATNPHAKSFYFDGQGELPKDLLPSLYETLTTEVIATENMMFLISRNLERFDRLTVKLQNMADDPNFWPGIDS